MIPAAFEYSAPASLDEALALLSAHGDEAKVLAGGQSLLPLMKLRLATPGHLVDLTRIPGLNRIEQDGVPSAGDQRIPVPVASRLQRPMLSIGALTLYCQIEESTLLRQACPLLPQTASAVADVQVRNRGTIGGSLAHADPAGDMAAAALALDATLRAVGPSGERWIPAAEFFTGFFTTALAPDEILVEMRVPVLEGWTTTYRKAAPRASGFAIAGVAVCLRKGPDETCQEIRIGVTGVTERPFRAHAVEDALRGKPLVASVIEEAAEAVAEGVWIAEDVRASAAYRAHLARIYASRAIQGARDADTPGGLSTGL
ncbi:MAG: xanthine dehydrogenase family protein subunit M [Chloroflexi bacterium]|nr:xanthine dehydrogenase family protein subunit M [Chloroflexota bacterium]